MGSMHQAPLKKSTPWIEALLHHLQAGSWPKNPQFPMMALTPCNRQATSQASAMPVLS